MRGLLRTRPALPSWERLRWSWRLTPNLIVEWLIGSRGMSIFIPLTFIAGIYGMNFEYMPELKSQLGSFTVLGAMIAMAALLVWYFRRQGWIGRPRRPPRGPDSSRGRRVGQDPSPSAATVCDPLHGEQVGEDPSGAGMPQAFPYLVGAEHAVAPR
jgi:hypothetical protein